jgi:hypothetical protein
MQALTESSFNGDILVINTELSSSTYFKIVLKLYTKIWKDRVFIPLFYNVFISEVMRTLFFDFLATIITLTFFR